MHKLAATLATFAAILTAASAHAAPVLMISIDGLRPGDVLEADRRGIKVPALSALVAGGAAASGVRNVLPTVTYPNHTTMITGVLPARHGISSNTTFDPLQRNLGGWYWYTADIKVPTLWDAVHEAGGVVASFGWPVSVGARSIDANVPEVWRARTPEDLKLLKALSTPGLPEALEAPGRPLFAEAFSEQVEGDVARAALTARLIALKHPRFTTLHLVALDHFEHGFGPGSPKAVATLEAIDTAVRRLVADAREVEPDLVVAVVSDHGFAPVATDVNLNAALVEAGLITIGLDGKPAAWEASAWNAGGSAAIVLARPGDAALQEKVATLLARLAADPANGIAAVADKAEVERRGAASEASFFVGFRPGFAGGSALKGSLLSPSSQKGTHGYFPDLPEMRSTLILNGPGVPRGKALGEVDMRDIAPTLAAILGVKLPTAEGKALF